MPCFFLYLLDYFLASDTFYLLFLFFFTLVTTKNKDTKVNSMITATMIKLFFLYKGMTGLPVESSSLEEVILICDSSRDYSDYSLVKI